MVKSFLGLLQASDAGIGFVDQATGAVVILFGLGYTLLDASVSYRFNLSTAQLTAYLKGQNLTDEDVRVHTSFLKDSTPLPGRSVAFGVRGSF